MDGSKRRIARWAHTAAPVSAGEKPRASWLLFLDAVVVVLVVIMLLVEDAGQLFKVVFFVLTIGTFFWDLKTFVVRGTFWVSLTTVVLLGAVWTGRVPVLELLDVPFFLAVLVLVFTVSKRRAEAQKEVERLLAEEQERAERLAELNELKADFTAMVVHEFGNPITGIRRLTEMLRFEDLGQDVKAYVLESIRGELGNLDALVADVQAAVAVEREDFRLDFRPVPLADVLEEAEKYGRSLVGAHPFRVVTDEVPDLDLEVVADPERVGQVLRNLLSNAVKYSPEASPVELRAKAGASERVRIEVADEGRGISPEDYERIFEKFARGRDSGGRVEGVGLGLYISRRLVRAHDSELLVSSEPGKGSVFGFELKLAGEGGREA